MDDPLNYSIPPGLIDKAPIDFPVGNRAKRRSGAFITILNVYMIPAFLVEPHPFKPEREMASSKHKRKRRRWECYATYGAGPWVVAFVRNCKSASHAKTIMETWMQQQIVEQVIKAIDGPDDDEGVPF